MSATRPYRNIAGDHLSQNLHHALGQHPFLDDPNLVRIRPVPTTTNIVHGKDLDR
ncbi:hypothetical protein ACFP8Z_02525 [Gemmobacter lanyuensis]|uniref:hypothetical protein n=1 Tax=Gemmobacter lanyuensis TaxID=1054497 RepID=UPI00361A826E